MTEEALKLKLLQLITDNIEPIITEWLDKEIASKLERDSGYQIFYKKDCGLYEILYDGEHVDYDFRLHNALYRTYQRERD